MIETQLTADSNRVQALKQASQFLLDAGLESARRDINRNFVFMIGGQRPSRHQKKHCGPSKQKSHLTLP